MTNMMSDLINLIQSISYLKVGILKKKNTVDIKLSAHDPFLE